MKKRLLTMLVLLVAVAAGAWAQEETLLTTITPTAKEQASYSTACGNRFIQLYCKWILSIPR